MADDTQSRTPGPNKLPKRYLQFQKRYPQVFQAYDALGAATAEAGPLSDKTRALVKLAIAAGGQMGGAVDNHNRGGPWGGRFTGGNFYRGFVGPNTPCFSTQKKKFLWVGDGGKKK